MRRKRVNKDYGSSKYWINRNKSDLRKFKLKRFFHNLRKNVKLYKENTNIKFLLFKQTLANLLVTIIIISVLLIIENFANFYWYSHLKEIPNWLIKLQFHLPKPQYPSSNDAVIELLSITASIAGVLLALFYPVITTLANTVYAKVPTSLRTLILKDKYVLGYLKSITYLTGLALTSLVAFSFGFKPGILILILLIILSLVVLFNLLKFGIWIYDFLAPKALIKTISKDLIESIAAITTSGVNYQVNAFQNFHRKNAIIHLQNMTLITKLTLENDYNQEAIETCFNAHIKILRYYSIVKKNIPIKSEWFPKKWIHKSYFESQMTDRGLVLETNTYVIPSNSVNLFWFEESVIETLNIIMTNSIKIENFELLKYCFIELNNLFHFLGDDLNTKIANKLFNNNKLIYRDFIYSLKSKGTKQDYELIKLELEVVEAYFLTFLGFEFFFLEKLKGFDHNAFKTSFEKISFQNEKTIFETGFPFELNETIEKISNNIKTEILLEGKKVTPDWYLTQWICAEYLFIFSPQIKETITNTCKYLNDEIKFVSNNKMSLFASFASHIGVQSLTKLTFKINELKNTMNSLEKFIKIKDEFKWLKPDFDSILELLKKEQTKLLLETNANIINISGLNWSKDYPDVFAHSYMLLTKSIFDALVNEDLELFKTLYPIFVEASFFAMLDNTKNFKHFDNPDNVSFQTIIELMEITGYAYLFAEISKIEFWKFTEEFWREMEEEKVKSNCTLLVAYYHHYKNNLVGVGINYTDQHRRKLIFNEFLDRKGIRSNENHIVNLFIPKHKHDSVFDDVSELIVELIVFTFLVSKPLIQLMPNRPIFQKIIRNYEKKAL
jgi:hypothetical protein